MSKNNKNIKTLLCKLGFHKYFTVGTQQSVATYEPVFRIIKKCERCGKVNKEILSWDESDNFYYEWTPPMSELLNEKRLRYRKIRKICSNLTK